MTWQPTTLSVSFFGLHEVEDQHAGFVSTDLCCAIKCEHLCAHVKISFSIKASTAVMSNNFGDQSGFTPKTTGDHLYRNLVVNKHLICRQSFVSKGTLSSNQASIGDLNARKLTAGEIVAESIIANDFFATNEEIIGATAQFESLNVSEQSLLSQVSFNSETTPNVVDFSNATVVGLQTEFMTGPPMSTADALVRYADGTGKFAANSVATLDDLGNMAGLNSLETSSITATSNLAITPLGNLTLGSVQWPIGVGGPNEVLTLDGTGAVLQFSSLPSAGETNEGVNVGGLTGEIYKGMVGAAPTRNLQLATIGADAANPGVIVTNNVSDIRLGIDPSVLEPLVDHNSLFNAMGLTFTHPAIDTALANLTTAGNPPTATRSVNDAMTDTTSLWTSFQIDSYVQGQGYQTAGQVSTAVDAFVTSNIAAPGALGNGLVALDGGGKIDSSFLPAISITSVTSQVGPPPPPVASSANAGDIIIDSTTGIGYISDGTAWLAISPPAPTSITLLNGIPGPVVNVTTTQIPEGANLYYTTGRVTDPLGGGGLVGSGTGTNGLVALNSTAPDKIDGLLLPSGSIDNAVPSGGLSKGTLYAGDGVNVVNVPPPAVNGQLLVANNVSAPGMNWSSGPFNIQVSGAQPNITNLLGVNLLTTAGLATFNAGATVASGNLSLTSGNIDLSASATVDGRDVSVDGSTLDAHVADVNNPHATTLDQTIQQQLGGTGAVGDILVRSATPFPPGPSWGLLAAVSGSNGDILTLSGGSPIWSPPAPSPPVPRLFKTSTAVAQDVNIPAGMIVDWELGNLFPADPFATYGPNPDSMHVLVNFTGIYRLTVSLTQTTATTIRFNSIVTFAVNDGGVANAGELPGSGRMAYIRRNSGNNDSTNFYSNVYQLNAGDLVSVHCRQEAGAGVVTLIPNESSFSMTFMG